MQTGINFKKSLLRCLLVILAVAVTVTMTPVNMAKAYAESSDTETVLTVNDTAYTKAQIVEMKSVTDSYSYTSKEEKTDYVKGVLLEELLKDCDKSATVEFGNVDGYTISRQNMTLQALIDGKAILAYQCGKTEDALEDILDTSKDDETLTGCLRLYTKDNSKPDKMINSIKLTESGNPGEDNPGEDTPVITVAVTGSAAAADKTYTLDELKDEYVFKKEKNIKYSWTNKSGTNGQSEVTGVTIKNFMEVVGLKTNFAEITFEAADGYSKTFDVRDMYVADTDGNYPLLAWKVDNNKDSLTFVIGKKDAEEQNKSKWVSDVKNIIISIKDGELATPASFKATKDGFNIKLTWKAVTDADGYCVEKYDSKTKKYVCVYDTANNKVTSKTMTGLKNGTSYAYKVKAFHYNADKKEVYSKASDRVKATVPALAKPSITKLTAGSKKITVKWTKVSGATEYKVYRATSKSGKYRLLKTVKSTTYTNKSLKKGNKYYYKVEAKRVVNGKVLGTSVSSVKYTKAK